MKLPKCDIKLSFFLPAPFNQAHEINTKQSDQRSDKSPETIGNQVRSLEEPSEPWLAELNGIAAEKRQKEGSENRHEIRQEYPVPHGIMEVDEEKEAEGHVGQEMGTLVLADNVLRHVHILCK